MAFVKPSIESSPTADDIWLDQNYEDSKKEVGFALRSLGREPSKRSVTNLRINPFAQPELDERYMSSEEEPSPSPDSDIESYGDEELKHKSDKSNIKQAEQPNELHIIDEYQAEIAIAVPIMAIGRPKLVDITNLAPMHKRIRTEKSMGSRFPPPPKKAPGPTCGRSSSRSSGSTSMVSDDNTSVLIEEDSPSVTSSENQLPKRKDSLPITPPDSWLPENDAHIPEEDEDYMRGLEIGIVRSHNDYDPYHLDPPTLSPRNSSNPPAKKPGSIARARKNINPQPHVNHASGWKGLTRSLSLAKRQEGKSRMLPRGPTERRQTPMIPPYPFGEDEAAP